jgi:suppressor of ftsI
MNRRSFLMAGGVAAGAALLQLPRASAAAQQPLIQPAEIRSRNGLLEVALSAAPGRAQLGEYAFPGLLYNGSYMPPLLRVRLGDTMRVRFTNALADDPSNLHYHGMSVSPQGKSDNVFVHVHPGGQFDYEVRIPATGRQGPGLFWYHPHAHGVVEKQILGGMSGGLVVDGSERLFPMLADLPERFLLFKHAELGENEIFSINGQVEPLLQMRPGETQFWRIGNIGATEFLNFRVEGMPLYVLATDGHPLKRPRKLTELFLGPGERVDAIAIGPRAGEYAMRTIPFQNEAWKKPEPSRPLATIVSAGPGAPGAQAETDILGQRLAGPAWIDEVRASPIARRRTLEYRGRPTGKSS